METLSGLVGLGTHITICGTTYRLRSLNRRDWAHIEERIKSQRGDPIETARRLAAGQPSEVAKELLLRAYGESQKSTQVTAGELDAWMSTLDGIVFQFWLQVRKSHPEIDESRAGELLEEYGAEFVENITASLQERFPDATREDVLAVAMQQEEGAVAELIAKGLGLPEKNLSTPVQPGSQTSHSTGPDGTPSSESDTAGHSSKSMP